MAILGDRECPKTAEQDGDNIIKLFLCTSCIRKKRNERQTLPCQARAVETKRNHEGLQRLTGFFRTWRQDIIGTRNPTHDSSAIPAPKPPLCPWPLKPQPHHGPATYFSSFAIWHQATNCYMNEDINVSGASP